MTLQLACSCDPEGNHAAHSAAMIHSVLAHSHGAHVHYLTGPGFPDESRELIAAMVEDGGASIAFHVIEDERVAGLPTMEHAPESLWYRVFLPELVPSLDRVLYVDLDVIVLDSLAPLWQLDLADHYIAAVTNVFMEGHEGRGAMVGLAGDEMYFNSGVLLMNLAAWRRDGCTPAVVDYAREHADRLGWADQDALNALLADRRLPLHPRWNCMNSVLQFPAAIEVFGREAVEEARRRPAIRHFEGPSVNKPWHYLCDREMRQAYIEHRRATPWPTIEFEGRTARNRMRRLVRRALP